jgi:hypothetical protein
MGPSPGGGRIPSVVLSRDWLTSTALPVQRLWKTYRALREACPSHLSSAELVMDEALKFLSDESNSAVNCLYD